MTGAVDRPGGSPEVTFTGAGVRRGFLTSIPFQIATAAFGVAFAILALSEGLAAWQAILMSVVVYSGTAQILAVDLLSDHASMLTIWAATVLVSARYVLLGTSMRDWFTGIPSRLAFLMMWTTGDQSWALANTEMSQGQRDVGYFLGLNVGFTLGWIGGTVVGVLAGGAFPEPGTWGLDYAATAAFIAILAGTWRGRDDLLPWVIAAGVALAMERWVGGQWYVLAGAVAGSLVGTLVSRETPTRAH